MIKYDKMSVNISYRNISHYLKLGYDARLNESLEIKTNHLPSVSHVKIDVICSICSNEFKIMYCKYLDNIRRHGFYGCKKCSRQKAALTSVEKYGVDNYSKTDEYKKRVEKTNIEKFGYKTNLISPEYINNIKNILKSKYGTENWYEVRRPRPIKKFKINEKIKTLEIDINLSENSYNDICYNEYILYRNECRRITNHNIDYLLEKWNGLDYYDKEDISVNFKLDHNDPKYPTIDHRVSIYYGYKNKINPSIIGSLDNICITKRFINSKKRDLNEDDFIKITS